MLSPKTIIWLFISLFLFATNAFSAWNVGPKECEECHTREYEVWKKSPHFESYKKVHKTDKAKKIVKALGERRMKKVDDCVLCHYTPISKKAKVKAGPSCESCHGAASNWKAIHNDFGKGIKKAEHEAPAHRVKRLADSEAAGMIASRMVYDISASCMQCHGLGNSKLSAKTLNVMMKHDHPVERDFEVIKYSQGKIRHRFVPPNVNINSKLDPADRARLFIGGQMAALVASNSVKDKSSNAKFQSVQDHRIATATKNLKAVAPSLPELKRFLASPNTSNAHKVVDAMKNKDLSRAVSGLLPKESNYK